MTGRYFGRSLVSVRVFGAGGLVGGGSVHGTAVSGKCGFWDS